MLVAHTPAEQAAARAVEAKVFLQSFGNTPEIMAAEYGTYEVCSSFVTVLDESSGTAAGVVRLILPDGGTPVKTLLDVAAEPWSLDVDETLRAEGLTDQPVVDVGSMAVDRRFRSGVGGAEVLVALCHGVLEFGRRSGVASLVTILDDRILRVVRMMGMPWTPLTGASSQCYLGSPASTPCLMDMHAVADSIRQRRPDLAAAVVDGELGSIACDPDDLSPARGGSGRPAVPLPVQTRRDTSGWQRPGLRKDSVDRAC